ncbi:MAG: helix-turn-helix domain-containing protein [Lewinellaceae bacterium]|nr:helix-turn-helix domain-containing protein [Saprospiraceae bacterium]MCB9338984.1 helix-turn-helix domain-containing protein [Lewinellaceae bacterium]
MTQQADILEKLTHIEELLIGQTLLQKEVLSFKETCLYLEMSESHLYKLTSTRQIPHFCPNGKKLYFNRVELDQWLQRNRLSTKVDIEKEASTYVMLRNRKRK